MFLSVNSFGLVLFTMESRHAPAAELSLPSLTEVVFGPIWSGCRLRRSRTALRSWVEGSY